MAGKLVRVKVPEVKPRRRQSEWRPGREHRRCLKAILDKGRAQREPLLDAEGIAVELGERRGRLH